jgi:hypothetical protein
MANTFGARNSCVIFEGNSKAKVLQKVHGTAILHCNIRRIRKGKFCSVFDD